MNEYIRYHECPVAGIEPMTATTARSFPRHTHDQYGIGVVDSGGHASWSGRGHVEAAPGNFICVNPGEVHDGRAIGHQGRSWRILYFDRAVMEEARGDVLDGARVEFTFASPVFADSSLRGLFETAFACTTASASDARMACETAILNLVARLGEHATSTPQRAQRPTACIQRVRKRIDDDPAASLTLSALAAEAGLSRYQMLRGFARQLGLTPHAYILQRRMTLARQLARAGYPLAEVAAIAGFCDQSHLNRCFIRHYGVTPKRYAMRT